MKMYIEDDHGNIIECKELKSVGEGDLIRNVVVLDSRVRDIMVDPPL